MRKKVALDMQRIRKPTAAQEVFRRMTEEILPYSTGLFCILCAVLLLHPHADRHELYLVTHR